MNNCRYSKDIKGEVTMEDIRTQAARALNPLLSEFELISGQALKSVFEKKEYGDIVKIIFDFEEVSLVVSENGDDDTIDFEVVKIGDRSIDDTYTDASKRNPWYQFIGKRFCWGWVTLDRQGDLDGVLISFEIITPTLILNVVERSIKVGIIVQINI